MFFCGFTVVQVYSHMGTAAVLVSIYFFIYEAISGLETKVRIAFNKKSRRDMHS